MKKQKQNAGITLIALVVTIVVLIILATISVNLLLNGNIIGRAEQSKEMYQVAQIREELSLVLGDAGVEKALNKEYNENGFLDEFILKQEPDAEILDNIIIKDGHAFELDRSVPKLGEYTGKKEDLAIPDLEVTTVVADDYRTATITINAKEEENGISKIEIIQAGFVIKEYTYDNKKEPITENFIAKQNGEYIVKVYSKINVSKITKVEGLVATVKYSPNGDKTYKKAHSVKVTVDDSIDKVKSIKYQWLQTTKEPAANTFVDSCNNGGTITKDGLNGSWYLWTLLETENGKTNVGRSEVFYFDNEGPTVRVTTTPLTEKSFKLRATATDTGIGEVSKYAFYVNGELKDTLDYKAGGTELEVTLSGAAENVACEVIGYDSLGNPKGTTTTARTKLYTWKYYTAKDTRAYYMKEQTPSEYKEIIVGDYITSFGKDGIEIDKTTGKQVVKHMQSVKRATLTVGDYWTVFSTSDIEECLKNDGSFGFDKVVQMGPVRDLGSLGLRAHMSYCGISTETRIEKAQGDYIDTVTSTKSNAHKAGYDGSQYWYSESYLS